MRLITAPIHALAPEHPEEPYTDRIVGTALYGTQATYPSGCLSELASTVGVEHHWSSALELPERHEHGLQHQLTVLPMAHRPADHNAQIEIEGDAQI